jgi:hypothetical protein
VVGKIICPWSNDDGVLKQQKTNDILCSIQPVVPAAVLVYRSFLMTTARKSTRPGSDDILSCIRREAKSKRQRLGRRKRADFSHFEKLWIRKLWRLVSGWVSTTANSQQKHYY